MHSSEGGEDESLSRPLSCALSCLSQYFWNVRYIYSKLAYFTDIRGICYSNRSGQVPGWKYYTCGRTGVVGAMENAPFVIQVIAMSEVEHIQDLSAFRDFNPFEVILGLPMQAKIGFTLFAVIWIVGGNILLYYSMKRRGIPFFKIAVPSFKTLVGFNTREYVILAALALSSLASGFWGMSAQ